MVICIIGHGLYFPNFNFASFRIKQKRFVLYSHIFQTSNLNKIFISGKFITKYAERNVVGRLIFKFYLLANVNKISIPLIAIPIYATIGQSIGSYFEF